MLTFALSVSLGLKESGYPAEQGATRVRPKLAPANPAGVDRLQIRAAPEEPVCIGDTPAGEAEAVQHGEAVKPVVIGVAADFELRRSGSHKRARKPRRHMSANGQLRQRWSPDPAT